MRTATGWILGMVLAACIPGVAASQQSAPLGDPQDCAKLQGLDAQMACLKKHMDGLKAMSDNAEPIDALPPDAPRVIGDRSLAACHAKGQSQPVWPNGKPMGATITVDECVENHGVVQADFTELCEAGVAIAKQAGPGNVVMRYLAQCPPAPKSKCSLKGLLREGADPESAGSYTARVDYLYYPDSDSSAADTGCTDKQFF